MATKSPKLQRDLDNIIKLYLDNVITGNKRDGIYEFEVRFGTARGMKPLTRIDYDNVIKRLRSQNFIISDNQHLLRIISEYSDPKTGISKMSNIRAEISGLGEISNYCKTNDIKRSDGALIGRFVQKSLFKSGDDNSLVDFEDFNFRAALNVEKDLTYSSLVKNIISSWKDSKKIFRYINRYSLTNVELGVQVDVSIVKESAREGRFLRKAYTFEESGLLSSTEKYEIEIEAINNYVGPGTKLNTVELLGESLRKSIKLVLSGIQKTNYPIGNKEQKNVLNDYMKLLWNDKHTPEKRVTSKNFIGPSSYTLQIQNISVSDDNVNIPNIRSEYTVTDKADGDRKLLYIDRDGKIYLIDTNMNVQFTGAKTSNTTLINTLLDGEHILHNKNKQFINLYAAFDVYYINSKDVRTLGFIPKEDETKNNFRLPLLMSIIKSLKAHSVNNLKQISPLRIENKTFYFSSDTQTIFQACNAILKRVNDGLLEYETDGLIFTPARTGVGSDKIGETTPPIKTTWTHSFKWKPPEFNTIDFLITTKKGSDGRDMFGNIFQEGVDTSSSSQLTQYKTLVLRVGFDERVHGYINPCKNIIDDDVPGRGDLDNEDGYKPVQFFPTNPSDDNAGICNIIVNDGSNGDKIMLSQEHEIIEDNMIVEFKYDNTKDESWRWVPLRVRYDKTAEFRSGGRNYGNAYHVANSNWHSIHNPVTVDMITTGVGIPDEMGDDDVYYNRVAGSSKTRGLRDFHNLYVKKKLISSVSKRGNTLIDLAVGKAGDLSKWISAKLKFVFGIDISRDNIENRLDGACARYLNYRKKYNMMPSALFVVGNSSVNIRNGEALFTEKNKQISNAVFGVGAKDASALGKGVYKNYGIADNGFDVCSIQFAIHYMFENKKTLHNFLRNVSETTKVGGYFIGTSYDGKEIFNLLNRTKQDENVQINDEGYKIWEVIKRYDHSEFLDNASSIGYAIDVYQESINKTFREYLVNYDYLTMLLENYGFILITKEEANEFGLPSANGSFGELYRLMEKECATFRKKCVDYGEALDMSSEEKLISFLNKYFVYKKTHNVDAKAVAINLMGETIEQETVDQKETEKAQEAVKLVIDATRLAKPPVKKLKRRLKLVD
jgi:mRNA (guanine-N7-)-methyltransferase